MARYINADAMLEGIPDDMPYKVSVRGLFMRAPAERVRPLILARWQMYSHDEAICSHCDYIRRTPFMTEAEARRRWGELPGFCERCGAVMRPELAEQYIDTRGEVE